MVEILRIVDEKEEVICSVADDKAVLRQSIMGIDEVSIDVTIDKPLPVAVCDYIRIKDLIYTLNREPDYEVVSEIEFSYSLVFESPLYELLDKLYIYPLTKQSKFYLTGTLKDFLELLIENISELYQGWKIDIEIESERKNILFESLSCREVLNKLAEEFKLEYYLVGKTIYYTERISTLTGLYFEQGRENGLYSIKQANIDSDNTVTRAYIFGSTKNLPPAKSAIEADPDTDPPIEGQPARPPYRNGEERLRFDERYIEDLSEYNKIVERDVFFEDIFPNFEGKIDSVEGDYNRIIHCPEIDFDITKQLIGGVTAKINFLTGDLTGIAFELNPTQDESGFSTTINLVRKEDETALPDSEGKRPLIPNDLRKAQPGDKFNFTDIIMPDSYVERAEELLRVSGREWLDYYKQLRVKFELEIDYRFLRKKKYTLEAGSVVTISIPQKGIKYKQLRVNSLERNLQTGQITCEVSNYLVESWEKKIQGEIQATKNSIDAAMSGANLGIEATKEWTGRNFARLNGGNTLFGDQTIHGNLTVNDATIDRVMNRITFESGIVVKSDLTGEQLSTSFSTAIDESGELSNEILSESINEEGEDTETLSQAITEETSSPSFESGSLGTLGNVSSAVDDAIDGSVLVKAGNTWVAAAAPSGGGSSENIVVDTTYGTFNNPDAKEESVILITCTHGDESASIGVTNSGKPVVSRNYKVGGYNTIRELACLTFLDLVIAQRDTVINAGNLANMIGSSISTCKVNNVSYIDLPVSRKSFYISCNMFFGDLSSLDILDESNADIKDLFITATTNDQHYLYINCLIPINKIKLKLNTKDELL